MARPTSLQFIDGVKFFRFKIHAEQYQERVIFVFESGTGLGGDK